MGSLNRYILGQLIRMFGFFCLVLAGLIWISRSVQLFDRIISDGNSALIFLELSMLGLPDMMAIALPFAGFASVTYVTNRMSNESELSAAMAGGFSPLRLSKPVIAFAIIIAIAMSCLTHLLIPQSREYLALREAEISRDQTLRLLSPGEFIDTKEGVTIFFEHFDGNQLANVLIQDSRNQQQDITYTARRAALHITGEQMQITLEDGTAQIMARPQQGADFDTTPRMTTSRFAKLQYNVVTALPAVDRAIQVAQSQSSANLFVASSATQLATGKTRNQLLYLAHNRISKALLAAIAVLVGFVPLIQANYSRFGLRKPIIIAILIVIMILALDNAGRDLARGPDGAWAAVYLAPSIGVLLIVAVILASNVQRIRRRQQS